MSSIRILKTAISILLLSSLISCGGGGQTAGNETWSLVRLISKGNPIDNVVPETIEVRNCVVPETKTTDCSAGTSSSLSVDFGGSVEFGEGVSYSIDSGVSSSLGIGRQSGQSISLDTPPSGYIYIYEVDKRFSVINGEVLAHSSNGNEQNVNYVFNASCSITIVSREQTTCSGTTVENPGGSPPNQTSSTTVTVFANKAWQDTGITVNEGDVVTIQYISGLWRWTGDRSDYDGSGDPSANGTYLDICTTNYDCPITDAPLDALIGRIGTSGTPFLIGNGITFTVPSGTGNNQKLYLVGNDSFSGLHDNVGSIEVSISK
jgi:hypothetical protein